MERLVDRYLRVEALALLPLHPNQHAYQAAKSVEMALHQFMVRVEKALDQRERTLGVFLDIEGTFNNTCYDYMCDALVKQGCDNIVQWITATLEGRVVVALLNVLSQGLRYPGGANRGVCCHCFCGVLLWMI